MFSIFTQNHPLNEDSKCYLILDIARRLTIPICTIVQNIFGCDVISDINKCRLISIYLEADT